MKRAARRRGAWIGPLCFAALALSFCLYTRIDAGHTALFTALGICLGYVFTLFPLLGFSGRVPLDPSRPPNGNDVFRGMAFAMLSRRIHRHSPAASTLEYAVATATRLAGAPAAVGPATASVRADLAAGRDIPVRQAVAASRELRAWFGGHDGGPLPASAGAAAGGAGTGAGTGAVPRAGAGARPRAGRGAGPTTGAPPQTGAAPRKGMR